MSETKARFVRVCALADLPDQGAIGVEVGDLPIAVVRAEGDRSRAARRVLPRGSAAV